MRIVSILTQILSVVSIPIQGSNRDEGGCCLSCGYNYCPSLDTCVSPGETDCQEFDFPYNALYKGSCIILPPKK